MTAQPDIEAFFDEPTFTVSYLVVRSRDRTRRDHRPGARLRPPARARPRPPSADACSPRRREHGLTVDWILETHAHADHLSAAPYLQAKTGAQVGIGEHIRTVQKIFGKVFNEAPTSPATDRSSTACSRDGERLPLGELELEVLHVPGHTPADMAYRVGDAVFVGDTMFMPDYGTARADFPGGDARQLYRSIRRLLALPPRRALFMCHDYKAPGRDTSPGRPPWREQRAAQRPRARRRDEDDVRRHAHAARRDAGNARA